MKHKLIFFMCIVVIICVILIVLCFFYNKPKPKTAYIKTNDKIIYHEQSKVYRKYAKVPMFKVLEAYDISIEWLDDNCAIISREKVSMRLSLDKMELVNEQKGFNYFVPMPDIDFYWCEHVDDEIILDTSTMRYILCELGVKTEVFCNYRKGEIYFRLFS